MKIKIIASGSKGNVTYIETKQHKILLDVGRNFKYIKEQLAEENINITDKYSNFEIPNNSYIIVEVKNYKKYDEIRKNIRIKKSLLNKFDIDFSNLIFLGLAF